MFLALDHFFDPHLRNKKIEKLRNSLVKFPTGGCKYTCMAEGTVSKFIDHHYRHFNAAVVKDASLAYRKHIADGGRMLVTLAGAMSTAELGLSLAEMIRKDKVHAISCTGANLEEDVYNLVAHDHYRRIPEYRHLTAKDEQKLLKDHLNRVTDTCIPEHEAMRRIEGVIMELWKRDDQEGKRRFPHEYFFEVLQKGLLKKFYQIDPKDSWMMAAAEKNLPMVVPGWEDSTLGNMFAAACMQKTVSSPQIMKSGVEYMISFADWYQKTQKTPLGFFQIGGGIAGDFPICVVPMLHQDMKNQGYRFGRIFVRSVTRPPATVPTQELFRMKRSLGVSWARILRVS